MWSLIVHGGAGAIDDRQSEPHQAGCRRAAEIGSKILEAGGSALDAVQAAVRALEDDEVFNAGTGGALDADGLVMTDAALFRGDDLAYGACGSVTGIRHPIDLARAILEDGKHALLVGPGALAFARARGVERVNPRKLEVDPSKAKWWFAAAGDTVGAVALDARGSIASATSTGGLLGKYAGRVGDSPIAGAGTYAKNGWGGVSATGHGETILRTVLGFQALVDLHGALPGPMEAQLLGTLDRATAAVGGRGGLIAVLPSGAAGWARNTAHMGVAWVREGAPIQTAF
ncbi:MAG: isoaspartyl peptidase/L-asparaginase [Myxococcota bacterium]